MNKTALLVVLLISFATGCWVVDRLTGPDECDESASPFGAGDGTAEAPYEICAPDHLDALGEQTDELDASFVLVDDIDLSDVDDFNVIGDQHDRFEGRFDGGGHTIEGLTLDREHSDHVGLFGYATFDAKIQDLTLESFEITGKGSVGALVGRNLATVTNVEVRGGRVRATDGHAGGLVGTSGANTLGQDEQEGSTIRHCSATADVEALGRAGGLVGSGSGSIVDSYATGDVTGVQFVGGLIGSAGGDGGRIARSFATGTVRGDDAFLGGLIGSNGEHLTVVDTYATGDVERVELDYDGIGDHHSIGGLVGLNKGEIRSSYSTGYVEADERAGGLVGDTSFDAATEDSYWDVDTSGLTQSHGGEGLSTEDFADRARFEGWDFDDVWTIDDPHDDNPRPILTGHQR